MSGSRKLLTGERCRLAAVLVFAFCAFALSLPPGKAWANSEKAFLELGEKLFFTKISDPPRQACATCHDPKAGGTNGNSNINDTVVAVPGANPHADPKAGPRKPQTNMYVGYFVPLGDPCDTIDVAGDGKCGKPVFDINALRGGNFWDGRATGELVAATLNCTQHEEDAGTKNDDWFSCEGGLLPSYYAKYLGPIADQAFASPFFNPQEQGLKDALAVCEFVEGTPWGRRLYAKAFDEVLLCPANNLEAINQTFAKMATSIAGFQMSAKNNLFNSKRDKFLARDGDKKFPIDKFNDSENLGHDLFYGTNDSGLNTRTILSNVDGALVDVSMDAHCDRCHSNRPRGVGRAPFPEIDDGTEPFQTYTDFGFHTLGLPNNPELVTLGGADFGAVDRRGRQCGQFATPPLRNLTKKPGPGFVKAYMHNGYFKTLAEVVLFYNTMNVDRQDCVGPPYDNVDGPTGFGCLNIRGTLQPKNHNFLRCVARPGGWTAEEAIAARCWPEPEVTSCTDGGNPPNAGLNIDRFGNIGLSQSEMTALVKYMQTLDDED